MNYDHEVINHGCQGEADYFSTLLNALDMANKYSRPNSPLEEKAKEAIRLVAEDLIETLEQHRRKVKVYTATVERNVQRKVSVEARDDEEAAKKLREILNPDETVEDIESEDKP